MIGKLVERWQEWTYKIEREIDALCARIGTIYVHWYTNGLRFDWNRNELTIVKQDCQRSEYDLTLQNKYILSIIIKQLSQL